MAEQWEKRVKNPIAHKTQELENSVTQQFDKYAGKAKETAYKPVDYYKKQDAFYRGLFWIAVGCLIVLWIISGS